MRSKVTWRPPTLRLKVGRPGCSGCEFGALVVQIGGPCPWCLYDAPIAQAFETEEERR